MEILRLKIFQPHAHYRIPFTFSRRHTYPIPPYSTVVGFICNLLGIKNQEEEKFKNLKEGLSLAIYGKFESLTREYLWLRNLEKNSHKDRFGSEDKRTIDHIPEHPGGQMPTRIDVLENVKLIIYIYHPDEKFLEELKETFKNPQKRVYPLHLGRAEDLILFEEKPEETMKIIEVAEDKKEPFYGQFDYYTWIPHPSYLLNKNFYPQEFEKFFAKIKGSYHFITSFYEIKNGMRNFKYVLVKLFEQGDFPFNFGTPFEFLADNELNIPLFFAKIT